EWGFRLGGRLAQPVAPRTDEGDRVGEIRVPGRQLLDRGAAVCVDGAGHEQQELGRQSVVVFGVGWSRFGHGASPLERQEDACYSRSAGSARTPGSSSRAYLRCAESVLSSGYSPEKQASQCVSRVE